MPASTALDFLQEKMEASFNQQILVDELSKLYNSQRQIDDLSSWCISYKQNAKQVVEIWLRQLLSCPREQIVAFLYLANEILRKSGKNGIEFINEFWKVLPKALSFALGKGDESAKAVLKLVCIWEEHQFFGSKSKKLREKIARTISATRNMYGKAKLEDARKMNEKAKLEHSNGELLQKIISGYFHVYDEDAWVRKCQNAIRIVDKVEKELGTANSSKSGAIATHRVQEVLQIQHHRLEECIGQLKTTKSSRKNLITLFKQALQEQEMKSAQNHLLLKAATSRHIKTGTGISSEMEAKLTSSSSSAKLQNLLFSLVSAGVIGLGESPAPKKKLKMDSNTSSQVPTSEPLPHPPVQLVPHLRSSSMEFPLQPPPPFPSTRPIASPTQTLLIQTSAGSSKGVPSRYNSSPSPLSNYPAMAKHSDPNSLNSHPSSLVMEEQNLSVQPPLQMVPPLLVRKQRIHYLKTLVAKYGRIPK